MSTNLPSTIPDFLNWCEAHSDLWLTNFASIGISESQAQAFKALYTAMAASNSAAIAARMASKDATVAFQNDLTATRATAAAFVAVIKAFAESTDNPNVYSLAGVSPDDPRSVLPPPLPPQSFVATVNPSGSIRLTWKVTQPKGVNNVTYMVKRRIPGVDSAFVTIGTAGRKEFTDETLPLGVDAVNYIVQPRRGDSLGNESNVLALQFGSVAGGGGGALSILSATTAPAEDEEHPDMKMAA